MKLKFSRYILAKKKYSNIKFRENSSSGIETVIRGRTDIKELMVAFRNFANAPKKCSLL